ncbi:MAG: ABC-F family ATP-binding cassette domain-containing protein [Zetaproteobacteria bacterium]|nr:ABC-F family ATP-binding cassette domain-containing protein [Zetaproteobacteria bacterium]
MALLLTCQSISKSFGTRSLFENLSFSVFDGDRIGVIGPNGVGKSTLLKILSATDTVDVGELTYRKHVKVGYIPQWTDFPLDQSILDVATKAAIQVGITEDEAVTAAYIQLSLVGFEDYDAPVSSLSGGWQKRLAIACGSLGEPDLLLLDEPTNHLDAQGLEWLEQYLLQISCAWMMISHDRFLLNQTVRKTLEVNRCFENFTLVTAGDYDAHLKHKEEFLAAQRQAMASLSSKVRREDEWLKRGPKARSTKAKYRIENAQQLQTNLAEVRGRLQTNATQIEFSASQRKTKNLVSLENVTLCRGEQQLLENCSYVFTSGRCVGLVGGNGAGKSSFLKMIVGQLSQTSGTIRCAQELQVVYFDQKRELPDPQMTLKRALSEHGDSVLYQGRSIHVHSWAKRFGFSYEQLETPVGKLSGGERARALIARLMLQPADILLLDEPTNDLDIYTLEVLEESLLEFPGAVILVTHDRYMLQRICDTYLYLDGRGGCVAYDDPFQWEREIKRQERLQQTLGVEKQKKSLKGVDAAAKKPKGLSFKEKKELDSMEEQILAAEAQLEQLVQLSGDEEYTSNPKKLAEIGKQLATSQARVDQLYARWTELAEQQ